MAGASLCRLRLKVYGGGAGLQERKTDNMKITIEKGRMFGLSWPWVHFVLTNPDIMATLNHAPMRLCRESATRFPGTIFGVKLLLEVFVDAKPDPKDEVRIIADVRMPLCLGRTYTVAQYRYAAAGPNTTIVDLQLSLETVGPFMGIYALSLKGRIDDYLSRVMSDNERAGTLLQDNDSSLCELLNAEQIGCVEQFRLTISALESGLQGAETLLAVSALQDKRAWHPELSELTCLYERIQGRASHIEQELIRIRETRDAVATLLVARRMLEVIVTQVCEETLKRPRGTEPLGGILGKISHDKAIPEYVLTSMENLNRLSTYGAHPKDFSQRQVREALMALCSIMEWYVTGALQKENQEKQEKEKE